MPGIHVVTSSHPSPPVGPCYSLLPPLCLAWCSSCREPEIFTDWMKEQEFFKIYADLKICINLKVLPKILQLVLERSLSHRAGLAPEPQCFLHTAIHSVPGAASELRLVRLTDHKRPFSSRHRDRNPEPTFRVKNFKWYQGAQSGKHSSRPTGATLNVFRGLIFRNIVFYLFIFYLNMRSVLDACLINPFILQIT